MGLSGPVAAVILVSALVAQVSGLLATSRNADLVVEQARDGWQRRHDAMQAHGLAITGAEWNATRGELNLTLNNTGAITMDAARLDVLLDGSWATDSVTARIVEGATSDVWAPAQALNLTVDAATKPADVVVASPWGRLAAARGI